MKKILILMFTAIAVIFSSCSKETIRGAGSTGSRTLTIPAFTAVETHYDIDAVISYGATQEVVMTGYDNLLNILDVKVENGILKLKYNKDWYNIRNGNIKATIKIPVIAKTVIHGSGEIYVNGFVNGNIFNSKIHGSGNIRIVNCNYHSALLEVYGSGNIEAQGLQAGQAEAVIHGSGNTGISVIERLKASIFGSGNIYYWGSPLLEVSQNGSGRVIKR